MGVPFPPTRKLKIKPCFALPSKIGLAASARLVNTESGSMFALSCLTARFPFRWKVLAALLCLVQVVAPTWHVCDMGLSAHCQSHQVELEPNQPLVCFCPESLSPFNLSAHQPDAGDETCLAMLLQTMSGQFALAPVALDFQARLVVLEKAREIIPARRFVAQFRGRAPPVAV